MVTIQRGDVLVESTFTERTRPLTVAPLKFHVTLSPRNWAKRTRRASFGSTISIDCIALPVVEVRETSPRQRQDIAETLSNDSDEA
jgi:hypothetical protein